MINIPKNMGVPAMRRDTTADHNVRWLLRNLPIHNGDHPELARVINECQRELLINQWRKNEDKQTRILQRIGRMTP